MRVKTSIRLFLIATTTLLVQASCQEGEVTERNEITANGKLLFNATLGEAETATRAAESDNTALKEASAAGVKPPHIVIETYTGTPGSTLQPYFSDELGYVKSGDYWKVNSGIERFLPNGGINLYAYFATDLANAGNLMNIAYTHPTSANEYPTLTYTPFEDDALHQMDLIAAKVENQTTSQVSIPFRHILSQLNFGVKGIDRHQITVTNIRINKVYGTGVFHYNSWLWTPDKDAVVDSYPYYFPDRTDRTPNSGLGHLYQTQGTADDSKNTYFFGDGGTFGPGGEDTFFYAQVDPVTIRYATKENTTSLLHNSLMLIPQAITKNADATVTFDYSIKIDGRVIRSGQNSVIRLDKYYDWKPNLRYVYVFNFDDPSQRITFNVLCQPWEYWDGEGGNGLKNGTIQEPTMDMLNTMGDGEILYFNGLLERNLAWNWSNGTALDFRRINYLYLDFAGVEMDTYELEVMPPPGFTASPSNASKTNTRVVLERTNKRFFVPTDKQISSWSNNWSFPLFGTLSQNVLWDWSSKNFTSLGDGMTCRLDFSAVNFGSNSLTINLPSGYTITPSTISASTTSIAEIKNAKTYPVKEPLLFLLNALSDGNEVGINGGLAANTMWDWGEVNFANLDKQEAFLLNFSQVTFGLITLELPKGFRAKGTYVTELPNSVFQISNNGTVNIRNNRIDYPSSIALNGVHQGAVIALKGEKITIDPDVLNWTSAGITFPYLLPQNEFTLNLTEVDYINTRNIKIQLPPLFDAIGYPDSNPYTFTTPSNIQIKNNALAIPTDAQLDALTDGQELSIMGGKLVTDEVWNWSALPMAALGGSSHRFSITIGDVLFNSNKIEVRLPIGMSATGTAVSGGNGSYFILNNTTMTVTDNSYPLPALDANSYHNLEGKVGGLTHGQTLVLSGTKLGNFHLYNFGLTLNSGQSISIDMTRLRFNYLEVWCWSNLLAGYTITATRLGAKTDNYFILSGPCVVTFTKI